jgi:hypothetical protein
MIDEEIAMEIVDSAAATSPVMPEAVISVQASEQQQQQLDVPIIRKARPPPIGILKERRVSQDTTTTPRPLLSVNEIARINNASTPTTGKRPRSPDDLLTQLMAPSASRDARPEAMENKRQRMVYRVRWEPESELRAVRIFEKDVLEGAGDDGLATGLTHQEEGEALKKKRKEMLKWYQPLRELKTIQS